MKKFKAKKKRKFYKIFIYIAIIYLIYQVTFNIIFDFKIEKSNEEFIVALLNDSNHHLLYEKRQNNLLDKIIRFIGGIDPNQPASILSNVFDYELKTSSDEEATDDVLSNYIEDPNPLGIENPRVYIYNTHQLEGYSAANYIDYNITPNVQMASYLLKDRLNNSNIPTIVESGNINDFLSLNGWDYSSSYKASRYYLEDALKKYNDLDLILDIHRDSILKTASTVEIEGKKYAKILFVVGKEYDNYLDNLDLANSLNNLIRKYYPTLSRGIVEKGGRGVNGVYNQDLSNKIVLIECGGVENTIDEVINTVDVLSKVIKEYLGE